MLRISRGPRSEARRRGCDRRRRPGPRRRRDRGRAHRRGRGPPPQRPRGPPPPAPAPASARRDPDAALLERLLAAGPVGCVTLAPELDGALELINLLHARAVVVSCGHTNATALEAVRAFDRGVASVTHLFNAMRPFTHRDPGIAGTALARDDVVVQLILDGHHVSDETAQIVWRAAAGRVALVTDAIAGAGVGDGRYRLGAIAGRVVRRAVRPDGGAPAGRGL